MVPALLIYGAQDKFVTLEEEQWMEEVSEMTAGDILTCNDCLFVRGGGVRSVKKRGFYIIFFLFCFR